MQVRCLIRLANLFLLEVVAVVPFVFVELLVLQLEYRPTNTL